LLRSLIPAGACALAAALLVAGCGGGSSVSETFANVRGQGFVVQAPSSWNVSRSQGGISASPKPVSSQLVSVSVFPLSRDYTPSLYALEVSKELDPGAARLAKQQNGSLDQKLDTHVAGQKARQYVITYSRNGQKLKERITFLFRKKTEYELLCQWEESKSEPDYCAKLTSGFRPT
jgi:DNA-binding winged helix-turn-helix (wHTH) protein